MAEVTAYLMSPLPKVLAIFIAVVTIFYVLLSLFSSSNILVFHIPEEIRYALLQFIFIIHGYPHNDCLQLANV